MSVWFQEPNDLAFSSGEIIEIVDENNLDWWTGKCRGRQGLFPSNHVEKLESSAPAPMSSPPPAAVHPPMPMGPPTGPPAGYGAPPGPPMPYGAAATPVGYGNEKPAYRPYGATYQAQDQPPPPGSTAVNSVGLQQAGPPQEQKKNKFGGLGNTVRTQSGPVSITSHIMRLAGPFRRRWCWIRRRYVRCRAHAMTL